MIKQGRLKNWNDQKGFGFIKGNKGEEDVFIHISAFSNRQYRPQVNQVIKYTLSKDRQGRIRAIKASVANIGLLKRNVSQNQSASKGSLQIALLSVSMVFFVTIFILAFVSKLPLFIIYLYILFSLISYALYRSDKKAAQLKYWRVQENTLHFLSLLGGWPGALVAQQTLRHKSSKRSFIIMFWLTVLFNLAGLAWLFTNEGQTILNFLDEMLQNGIQQLRALIANS